MSIFELFYKALMKENEQEAAARYISRHLARVALYELKGIDALHPDVKPLALELINQASQVSINIYLTETFRPASIQQKYYNQGRKSPGSIVTNAQPLQSYHQYGLAFDIAFKGSISYPNDNALWQKVGEIGEKTGLIWGGRFNDKPHFEYYRGYTWKDLIKHYE